MMVQLLDHYYNLETLNTIPSLVFTSLNRAPGQRCSGASNEAQLQCGLCYAVGFGVQQDTQRALSLVKEAATGGLLKAQAILFRLHTALGVSMPSSDLDRMINWLVTGSRTGSTTALADLRKLDLESYYRVTHELVSSLGCQASNDDRFLLAVRSGDIHLVRKLIPQIRNIDCEDTSGATCLHWVSTCLDDTGPDIANLLLENGARVNIATRRASGFKTFGNANHYLNTIPPQTTPLEWAIMQDNLLIMKILIEASKTMDSTFFCDAMESTPIACASRYQSKKCLEWLCATGTPQDIAAFDGYSFSALYCALRADILDRMLRFSPDKSEVERNSPQVTPVVERELEVIRILLESGSGLDVHEENAFTCLHIAAAVGHPEVFRSILAASHSTNLLDSLSDEGYTPLKEAISRGDTDIFTNMLDSIVDRSKLWCGPRFHAIHLCSMNLKPISVEFAKMVLGKDPRCLQSISRPGYLSPLHIAAVQGNRPIIDFLVSCGAVLLQVAGNLTPLGYAIRARSTIGVEALCVQHRNYRVPLIAALSSYKYLLPPIGMPIFALRTVPATTFLLAPGAYSQKIKETLDMGNVPFQPNRYIGCYDDPFSEVSQNILDSILKHYQPVPIYDPRWLRFWRHRLPLLAKIIPLGPNAGAGIGMVHKVISVLYRRNCMFDAGLMWAIRMGNLAATKIILDNRSRCQYKPRFRDLIELAYYQNELGDNHVAIPTKRFDILQCLQQSQKEEYKSVQDQRRGHPVLKWFWVPYYSIYGDPEQHCFEQCHKWESLDRPFFVFGPWCRPQIPLNLLAYCALWAILIPMMRNFSTLMHNPVVQVTAAQLMRLIGVTIMVSR